MRFQLVAHSSRGNKVALGVKRSLFWLAQEIILQRKYKPNKTIWLDRKTTTSHPLKDDHCYPFQVVIELRDDKTYGIHVKEIIIPTRLMFAVCICGILSLIVIKSAICLCYMQLWNRSGNSISTANTIFLPQFQLICPAQCPKQKRQN